MTKVTIDNVEYDTDSMSDDALASLQSIQFVDGELAKVNAMLSVMNTARNAYFSALQQQLSNADDAEAI
jgi:hypothetical protein